MLFHACYQYGLKRHNIQRWSGQWTHLVVHLMLSFANVFQGLFWALGVFFTAAGRDSVFFKVLRSAPVCEVFHAAAMQLWRKGPTKRTLCEYKVLRQKDSGCLAALQVCHCRCFGSGTLQRAVLRRLSAPCGSVLKRCYINRGIWFVQWDTKSDKSNTISEMENLPLTVLWMASTATLLLSVLL